MQRFSSVETELIHSFLQSLQKTCPYICNELEFWRQLVERATCQSHSKWRYIRFRVPISKISHREHFHVKRERKRIQSSIKSTKVYGPIKNSSAPSLLYLRIEWMTASGSSARILWFSNSQRSNIAIALSENGLFGQLLGLVFHWHNIQRTVDVIEKKLQRFFSPLAYRFIIRLALYTFIVQLSFRSHSQRQSQIILTFEVQALC